jgi:hypothetical protein
MTWQAPSITPYPLEIITCVEAGVDLIDASFCHACTQQGLALSFLVSPPTPGDGGRITEARPGRNFTIFPAKLMPTSCIELNAARLMI